MMNVLTLFLAVTSLAGVGIWSPPAATTIQKQVVNSDVSEVIVKEGHRVIVVEYDKEQTGGQGSCGKGGVVRVSAQEQFSRLLLNYEAEMDLSPDSLLVEYEVLVYDANDEVSVDILTNSSESSNGRKISLVGEDEYANLENENEELTPEVSLDMTVDAFRKHITSPKLDSSDVNAITEFQRQRRICTM
ncbi:hypothetical protein QQ045_032530 [Rhodiola kirilowii]